MIGDYATLAEVKSFFNLSDNDLDDLLQYLITHYTEIIFDKTGETEKTIKTNEALLFAIGCHLTKIRLDKIYPTIAYTVGNVKVRTQAPANSEESWCDLYQQALSDILSQTSGPFVAVGKARKGLSKSVFG